MTTFLAIVALLCVLLALGFPVAFALGLAGLVGIIASGQSLEIVAEVLYSSVDNFVLLAIPLFVLMSRILMKTGMGEEIFDVINAFFRHLRGGLAAGAVICCAFFAAISGSSVTNAAALGLVAIPSLARHGYPKKFAAGLIAAGGTMGILIPPSIPFIVYGAITEQSVGKLFLAGVIPGLLVTGLILGYAVYASWVHGYGTTEAPMPWSARLRSVRKAFLLLCLPLIILGGIYTGVFTPTEASAAGVVLTLFLAGVVYRRLTPGLLWTVTKESVHVTVMIFAIIAGAKLFGHVSATMQIPQAFAQWIIDARIGPLVFLPVTMLLLLFLGDFLDPLSIILIVVPVLLPAIEMLKIDPIWFGVLLVINMELANITPPVGLNLFVIQSIQPELSYDDVLRGTVPFMIVIMAALLIVWWQPALATWLPAQAR